MRARPDVKDLPAEVREVADALITSLGDDLRALFWQGSWARGEQTPESDHDLLVVLKQADDETLLLMQRVFAGRKGWSTFVKTEDELRQFPLGGRLQFRYGLIPIYGDIERLPLTREAILAELQRFIVDINHECRYRIIHGATREYADADLPFVHKRNARWMYYMAKSAIMAMKARELLRGNDYPNTRRELRDRLSDADELAIVDTVDRWAELRPQYEEDCTPLALQLDAFARKLVAELEAGF